jgi:tRNA pseudouridine38-40 synthase
MRMPRYRLTIEYDGTDFVGWQRQDNGPSIQAAIEAAITCFCGHPVAVTGAGRTDAGVHALAQVAHVDLERDWPPATVRAATNFHLRPLPVAVVAAGRAAAGFHARFSARQRFYRYRILDRPAPPVLSRGQVWWVPASLDAAAMAEAGRHLSGRHDFSAFRAAICQARSPMKTLDVLNVARVADEIRIEARARSFLHNQVRIIAGTLKRIGEGGLTVADLTAALTTGERSRAGPTAPACGLCLVSVSYPPGMLADPSVEAVGDGADEEAQQQVDADDTDRG